jgi:two-component sensor histidine kinase
MPLMCRRALWRTTGKMIEKDGYQTEKYLIALNQVNNLLSADTPATPFQDFINLAGSVSSADRAYIFLNHTAANDEVLMSSIAEWPSKCIDMDKLNLQNISYNKFFPRWYKKLSEGSIISDDIQNFPRKERYILKKMGIKSILIVPLMCGAEFIGLTTFEYSQSHKRQFNIDREFLKAVTHNLSHRIEKDWVLSRLKTKNDLFTAVMDAMNVMVYAVDPDTFEIIYMNKYAISKFGDCIGRKCWKIFYEQQKTPCSFCQINKMINLDGTLKKPHTWEHYFPQITQWCSGSTQALKWPDGRTVIFQILTDITHHKREESMLQKSIEEKDSLLGEVYHRVKNNLQSLIYLISMQADYIDNPHAIEVLKELQERIRAMSLVHTQLYRSKNLANIHVDKYVAELLKTLLRALAHENIKTDIHVENITLDIRIAIPFGLIINELVTNIIKHAFKENKKNILNPEIKISFIEQNELYILKVSDNGVGFTMHPEYLKHTSMGLKLVTIWSTHQLGGTLDINEDSGVEFIITFPKKR